jgi:hypothetical protein
MLFLLTTESLLKQVNNLFFHEQRATLNRQNYIFSLRIDSHFKWEKYLHQHNTKNGNIKLKL